MPLKNLFITSEMSRRGVQVQRLTTTVHLKTECLISVKSCLAGFPVCLSIAEWCPAFSHVVQYLAVNRRHRRRERPKEAENVRLSALVN
jgi:hypothetical protein